MLGSKSLLLPLSSFADARQARVRASATLPEGNPSSVADPTEGPQRKRGSPQLERWSRARALRSGRKLHRRTDSDKDRNIASAFLVSVNCDTDEAQMRDHLQIDDLDRLMEVIKQAAKEGALLLYTLADPSMAEAAEKACKLWGVPFSDILGPITEAIATHLGVAPSGIPRGAPGRNKPLSEEYFRRIEAIDFTIKQDDGAQPQNLARAHIVLVGVSRTGKTPLSIYLAQKGYKVANVPIVLGIQLPKTLFEINQEKIYALTINPVALQIIRRTRAKSLRFTSEMASNYSDMDHVRKELGFASKIYAQNPSWPVIEVTEKSIEETSAVILRILHDRKHKHTMPRISKW